MHGSSNIVLSEDSRPVPRRLHVAIFRAQSGNFTKVGGPARVCRPNLSVNPRLATWCIARRPLSSITVSFYMMKLLLLGRDLLCPTLCLIHDGKLTVPDSLQARTLGWATFSPIEK